jgi:hypothetical protein
MRTLPGIVQTKSILLSCALVASLWSTSDAAEAPITLDPHGIGTSITYHIQSERSGSRDAQRFDTDLTIRSTPTGVVVISTTPATTELGSLLPDGSITLTSDLRRLIAPYNELQSAFHGINGTRESTTHLSLGDTDVLVPLMVTTSTNDGQTSLAFAGQADASVRSVRVHVSVNVHASLLNGSLVAAAATNDVTARVMFRTIHVQQRWAISSIFGGESRRLLQHGFDRPVRVDVAVFPANEPPCSEPGIWYETEHVRGDLSIPPVDLNALIGEHKAISVHRTHGVEAQCQVAFVAVHSSMTGQDDRPVALGSGRGQNTRGDLDRL